MTNEPARPLPTEEGRRREEGGKAPAPLKRASIRSFRDLEVYQLAQLAMARVHKVVLQFPEYEKFGLTDQMRRASKSVGALISEGWGLHQSTKEFKNFLRRSRGSANEMEAHLDTAKILGYVSTEIADGLIEEYRVLAAKIFRLAANWRSFDSPSSSILLPPSAQSRRAR